LSKIRVGLKYKNQGKVDLTFGLARLVQKATTTEELVSSG